MTRRAATSEFSQIDEYPADTLGMAPDEMRRLGHKMVDMVVDRLERRGAEAALRSGEAQELAERLGGPAPREAMDADASLDLLSEVALAHMQHGDHPRYFARVPGPSSFAAVLGDWLGVGFNTICSSWGGGAGPATVELVALDWLREMVGLPAGTEGVLLSGGSLANLTAFTVARNEVGPGVVYMTDQTHASLRRNLQVIGHPDSEIRVLETDADFRLPVDALAQAISHDKSAGHRPQMILATAGTTNTGAVDPLEPIADLCLAEGAWLHVDGAYGAPAAVTARGSRAMAGLERADSLALDPHKWLFQPYDVGACLVTRPGALERCFAMSPEYLKDVQGASGEVNFNNRGPELSRRSRALKLWMTFRTYGLDSIRDGVQAGINNAEFAEAYLRARPDRWSVVAPAQLGVVCFALTGADKAEHEARAQALADSGFACLSTTVLKGRPAFRLVPINPLTTEADITRTIDFLSHRDDVR